MTVFHIDLLHPGTFAKSRRDWFSGPQAGKRLLYSYAGCALVILLVLGVVIPQRFTIEEERETIKRLKQRIALRQKDFKDQQALYRWILDLGKYRAVWSDALQALGDAMPANLSLQKIELLPGSKQLLRLVVVTTLRPGSGNLVELDKLLNRFEQDPRLSRFKLQDWEVALSGSEREAQQLVTTVTFDVLP
ncbi:MAG: hypothetical protein HY695_38585 [Deltaproteobacteria bacterium]|nr:hypothetical protein [Deltaproteobacteria bacterium]